MSSALAVVSPFKWRHFAPEIILLAVRWSLRYSLSLRDVEELLAERGLAVDHTTIWRVVLQTPEVRRWGAVGRKQFSLRSDAKECFDEAVLRPYVPRWHGGNLAFA